MSTKDEYEDEQQDDYSDISNDIAIIGMAGRFPMADNVDEFWTNLVSSRNCITHFSLDELAKMGAAPAALANPNFVPAAGFIPDQDKFDAHFFEMNPREAAQLDPQHRFALEVAWQTLEHAGYTPESVNGSIGVFAGVNMSTYFIFNLLKGDEATSAGDALDTQISVDKDMFASRISYKLNLNGPSVALGTACSTSLVCIHLACQSLLNGESKMALAGGSHLSTPNCTGHIYHQGGYSSPDGYCRAFDAKGKGTVGGAGTCFVLLKRLEDAIEDNDTVYAVIKGSAVNNDGSEKIGYTAPSITGQTNIIAEAQAVAGVEPDTIRFIEAHGTATELGDPIEFAALTRAFRLQTDKKNFCGIGSVKTNIGHLGVAAGAASIVKAALALKHKVIPESLNFENPNPKLDIENSPFYVVDKLERIEPGEYPARAGVSSLGIGGTNAHIVLEEPPEAESSESRPWQLLLLSAKTPGALDRMTENLSAHLAKTSDENIADVAYTLQVGRRGFGFRRAFVVPADRVGRIAPNITPAKGFSGKQPEKKKKVVFMFPGGGTQYVNMARDLYEHEPAFRQTLDTCAALFKRKMDLDVVDLIYPDDAHIERNTSILQTPKNFFAALFSVEYSLAKLWMSWGVKPDAMIGHSLGEYTAACIAGVFTLEQAVDLICFRGALFDKIEKGSMFSVTLPAEQVKAMLIEGVSIATINDPGRCVVAGRSAPMQEFEKLLIDKQVEYQKLQIDTAGHSPMIDPIMAEFGQFLSKVKFGKSTIPFISNMSGGWAEQSEISSPDYWKNHLRQTVRFSDGVTTLLKDDNMVFLEMGPGNALCSFVRAQLPEKSEAVLLNTLRHIKEQKNDQTHLLETMGKLWIAGADIDWKAFYADEKRKRIGLPGYSFERKRYWIESQKNAAQAGAKLPVAEWLWQPGWRLEERTKASADVQGPVVVLCDDRGYGKEVVEQLRTNGVQAIAVMQGPSFHEIDAGQFQIDANNSEHYQQLIQKLAGSNALPETVLHCWGLMSETEQEKLRTNLHFSFIYLAKALEMHGGGAVTNVVGITTRREAILNSDQIDCIQALITGPEKVIPYEYPAIRFTTMDIEAGSTKQADFARFAIDELAALEGQPDLATSTSIALRNGLRFVKDYVPLTTDDNAKQYADIKQGGVYIVTGGLGGVGMVHALALAAYKVRLVLLQRAVFPSEEKWNESLGDANASALLKEQVKGIQSMQAQGSTVEIVQADVTDAVQLASAIERIRKQYGAINGLVHCAGYGEFVPVRDTSKAVIDAVLAPKVNGTDNLLKALANDRLDFVLFCSSMSVATTGYGLVGYVSACAYLDAIAYAHRNDPVTRYVSIDWDVWNTPQQTARAQNDSALRQKQQDNKNAILPSEGIDVIYRALASGKPQAIVSTIDFQKLLRKNRKMSAVLLDDSAEAESETGTSASQDALPLYERPSLSTEYVAPSTDDEKLLASIWQETLGIDKIGVNDNFFELGGESLLGVKIVVKAKKMGLFIDTKQMFATPTIAEIVKNSKKASTVVADQSLVMGSVRCTPVQQQFLDMAWTNKDRWNVGALLNVKQDISEASLKKAALCLLNHHDVLRSHFARAERDVWQQLYTAANSDRHVEWIDLSLTSTETFGEKLQEHCRRLQNDMHAETGPVFKLAYFKAANSGQGKIALLFHHLVMDAISLGIVTEDLQAILSALAPDDNADISSLLPSKTSSYKDFSAALPDKIASLQTDLAYWQKLAEDSAWTFQPLKTDIANGTNLEEDTASLSVSLSADLTQKLSQHVARHAGLKINELLLVALAKTIAGSQQRSHVMIDMVHHGRPDFDGMDFSRTIGWFGTGCPIPLTIAKQSLGAQLASLKQQIQSVPQHGLSLAWLKTLHGDPAVREKLFRIPAAEVSLNYIGQIDHLAAGGMSAQDGIQGLRDPLNKRLYLHDVIAYSQNGQLTLNWSFSKKQYAEAKIQSLLNELVENLQALSEADRNAVQSADSHRKVSDAALQACGLRASQIEECYGLTALQSEIYRRYCDESQPLANVTQAVTVMEGAVDKKLLQAAWQALVARHKVLRTCFLRDEHGEPVQVVRKHADFSLIELDYSHLDEARQQMALLQLQATDRLTRYDLSRAPALRLYWITLSQHTGRFAIMMSNHQIILDGWTSSLLSKDLIMCLMSIASGRELPVLHNNGDFGQYIDWLSTQSLDETLAYWRKTFDGYRHVDPLHNCMSAQAAISNEKDAYADLQFVIDDSLLAAVQETAKASRTTGNAVFQAAWALSLAQAGGVNDIVYGATVSGRSAEFDGMTEVVGQCTNSLPVRISIASDMTAAQLLQTVHAANAQAQLHNLPSLTQIAEAIGHGSHHALYSSNFIYENIPRADSGGIDLPVKTIAATWTDGWQFPLRVFIVPEDKTWVRFAFDRSRFSAVDIDKLAARYRKNLEALTKSIHMPVSQIAV